METVIAQFKMYYEDMEDWLEIDSDRELIGRIFTILSMPKEIATLPISYDLV